MIDLNTLFQKCLSDENFFRLLQNDLYPNKRVKTNMLATILSNEIGREIPDGDFEDICCEIGGK